MTATSFQTVLASVIVPVCFVLLYLLHHMLGRRLSRSDERRRRAGDRTQVVPH